jgi:PPOX class probable F420-dependent enzyme
MHHRAMGNAVRMDPRQRKFAELARRATLATIGPDGVPRLVPICFVIASPEPNEPDRIYSPLDDKPKSGADPRDLARVRDIVARPSVGLLIDRWSEEWTELAWLRVLATASVLEPDGAHPAADEHAGAVAALRAKYPQYATHRLEERPILRFTATRVVAWGRLDTSDSARV